MAFVFPCTYAKHLKLSAAINLAANPQYLCADLLEASGHATRDNRKERIDSYFLYLAVDHD